MAAKVLGCVVEESETGPSNCHREQTGIETTGDKNRVQMDLSPKMMRPSCRFVYCDNHHSAKCWRRVLLLAIERYRTDYIPKLFRGDAAFANPALYRFLENEDCQYAIRIPANDVLEREISAETKMTEKHVYQFGDE